MNMELKGVFEISIFKDGKELFKEVFSNGITNVGKNHILDTFLGAEAKDTWYIGLIGSGATLSAADTLASHAGWNEVTSYVDDRKEATFTDPASGKMIKSDAISFTTNAETVLRGAFLCNNSSKGTAGETGILWSTGLFTQFTAPDASTVKVKYYLSVR